MTELPPGWLKRDMDKAARRLEELAAEEQAMDLPTAKAEIARLRQRVAELEELQDEAIEEIARAVKEIVELKDALQSARNDALEEASQVAREQGCSDPDCRECVGGNIAFHIRNLKGPAHD